MKLMRVLLVMLASVCVQAQALAPGAPFPAIETNSLADAKVRFPDASKGKPALAVFSFSREASEASKAWGERFEKDKPGSVYIVPVLEGAPRLIRGLIRSGMRKEIPSFLHGRTIPIYAGEKEWKARLGFKAGQDKDPFLALLDGDGKVAWLHRGPFSPAAYDQLLKVSR